MRGEYSRMSRTSLNDIHTERDRVPWYYRCLTIFLSWLALGGYVLFALVFTSEEPTLRLSRMALTAIASALLTLGYGGAVVAAVFSKSLLFTFDAILIPFLTSSFLGVFTIVMNHALHKSFPISNNAFIYIPLVLACGTTITAATLAFIVWRRLGKVKGQARKQARRAWRWNNASMNSRYGDSATELMAVDVREDEAQRQQLLRLLAQRDRAPSPDDRSSTYRIHLPGEDPTPKPPGVLPYARQRSDSAPSITNKWVASNLLGRVSPETDSQSEERERRRVEIERSSITLTPSLDQSWPPTPNPRPAWLESVSSLRHAK